MEKAKFTSRKVAISAMFTALAFGVSRLEIPFPVLPFLKLDFSFTVMLLASYVLGPLFGEIIVLLVSVINLIVSSSLGVGELANFILANVFVVLPSLIYLKRKGLKAVLVTLILCTVLESVISLLLNRFVLFPFYFGSVAKDNFISSWEILLLFNVVKCVANGTLTVLLYKRLKNVLRKYLESPDDSNNQQ